jgi:hypothetical protein
MRASADNSEHLAELAEPERLWRHQFACNVMYFKTAIVNNFKAAEIEQTPQAKAGDHGVYTYDRL